MKSFFLFSLVALFVSTVSVAQTFNGSTGAIPDMQSTSFTIPVNGLPAVMDTNNFGLEKVCFTILHPGAHELVIKLTAPDGNSVSLSISNTGMGGPDFDGTCIDGISSQHIDLADSPRTGNFVGHHPIGLLNNGTNPNGNWVLTIDDHFSQIPANVGTLTSLSLAFSNDPAPYFALQESQLPIMLIQTSGEIVNDPKIMADMQLIYNGPGVTNHITDAPNAYNGKIGIETRGDASAYYPQKPYAIELWDAGGNEIEQELLGMPEETDWVLISNYNDKSFARNVLAQRLFGEMGHYSVRGRFVDLVINGHYDGVYLLMEKIKRDTHRVDVPKLEPTEISGVDMTGGYIFKLEYNFNSPNDHFGLGHILTPMMYYYPQPDVITNEQKTYLQQYVANFENTLYSPQFADPVNGFRKFIKDESFIDYMLMTELTMNGDGYNKSRYFSKKKDDIDGTYSQFKAGPVWDFDWAMKYFAELPGTVEGFSYYGDWYERMMEDPTFTDEVRCRYNSLRTNVLSDAHIDFIIDSVAAVVNQSQQWNFNTWKNIGISMGEIYASQSYPEEIQRLKALLHARLAWIDANLPGNPVDCDLAVTETTIDAPQVFPNPFNETIHIRWNEDFSGASIQLKDATGRAILVWGNAQPENGSLTVNIDPSVQLSAGMYYLSIGKAEQVATVKLVHTKN